MAVVTSIALAVIAIAIGIALIFFGIMGSRDGRE
jgi:hypothetical protein